MKLRVVKQIITLSTVVFTITWISNACGVLESSQSGGDALTAGLAVCKTPEPLPPQPGQQTVSTVYGRGVLENMITCTGLGRDFVSQQTIEEEAERLGSFSEYGSPDKVTAAMMMGIAAVAVEVCNDLITKEKTLLMGNPPDLASAPAYRKIFSTVDFASSAIGTAAASDTVVRLARSCWSRDPSEQEKQQVLTGLSNMMGLDVSTQAISVCTSMLASLSGIAR